MPALTGDPWRGLTKLQFTVDNTGSTGAVSDDNGDYFLLSVPDSAQWWEGDQNNDWDYTPGASITLRLEYMRLGALATWGRPTEVSVQAALPDGGAKFGTIWTPYSSTTVEMPDSVWTRTIHFDDDPLSGALSAALRCGMVEFVITARRHGQAVNWGPNDSRGGGSGGAGTHRWSRGYWRARCQLQSSARDNDSGFASAPATYAYPDELHLRAALAHDTYRSVTITHKVRDSAGDVRSKATAATTTGNRDAALTATSGTEGRVNDDFDEVGTAHTHRIVLPSNIFDDLEYVWHATTPSNEAGWTRVDDSTLDMASALTVDPRITLTRHMQVNDNTYATPPSASDVGINRLSSDLAFVTARATNARGEGIAAASGLQMAFSLRDNDSLVDALTKAAHTVSQQGGEDGWGGFLTWDSQLPGGGWTNTITLTDAAGAQTAVDNTHDLTLLAPDPRIVVVAGGGNNTDGGHHFVAGKVFVAALSPVNAATGLPLDVEDDLLSDYEVALTRLNTATTKAQHFDGTSWVDTGAGPITFFAAVRASVLNPAFDDKVFLRTFGPGGMTNVDTSGWGLHDILVLGRIKVNATPYGSYQQIAVVGKWNSHSKDVAWLGIPAPV